MLNGHKTVMLMLGWRVDEIQRGVADYAREHHWHLVFQNGSYFEKDLASWHGDGLICALDNKILRMIRPETYVVSFVVESCANLICAGKKIVREDDHAIGKLAAEYFRKKGFSNFAVYSISNRAKAFKENLAEHGFSCTETPEMFNHDQERLAAWLAKLPKPCALFCENDWDASDAVNAAILNDIRIPREIAVLGVGNDELICRAPSISISSIECRYYELGQLAASELDRMLDGKMPREEYGTKLLLPPEPFIVERGSSDSYSVSNPKLAKILEYMSRRAAEKITVHGTARNFYLSDAALYKLFMRNIGVSPKQFLRDRKLCKAVELLGTTGWTMSAIADECGFPTPGAFFSAFRDEFGCAPGKWREKQFPTSREDHASSKKRNS